VATAPHALRLDEAAGATTRHSAAAAAPAATVTCSEEAAVCATDRVALQHGFKKGMNSRSEKGEDDDLDPMEESVPGQELRGAASGPLTDGGAHSDEQSSGQEGVKGGACSRAATSLETRHLLGHKRSPTDAFTTTAGMGERAAKRQAAAPPITAGGSDDPLDGATAISRQRAARQAKLRTHVTATSGDMAVDLSDVVDDDGGALKATGHVRGAACAQTDSQEAGAPQLSAAAAACDDGEGMLALEQRATGRTGCGLSLKDLVDALKRRRASTEGGLDAKCACGCQLKDAYKYCPSCGEERGCHCSSCGIELVKGMRFCFSCGSERLYGA